MVKDAVASTAKKLGSLLRRQQIRIDKQAAELATAKKEIDRMIETLKQIIDPKPAERPLNGSRAPRFGKL